MWAFPVGIMDAVDGYQVKALFDSYHKWLDRDKQGLGVVAEGEEEKEERQSLTPRLVGLVDLVATSVGLTPSKQTREAARGEDRQVEEPEPGDAVSLSYRTPARAGRNRTSATTTIATTSTPTVHGRSLGRRLSL